MSGDFDQEDDAWDEEQWEAFLRDNDRRVDRYMDLLDRFMRKHPRPASDEGEAYEAWKEALRAFLVEKGWHREDISLPFQWLDEEETEGEEVPPLEGDLFMDDDDFHDDLDDFQQLPIYQRAFALTSEVMDWAHALSGDVKDSTLVHFCSHVTQIPANIAKGHGIGLERDALGGNIACVKRGLADANVALDLLRQMKQATYMDPETYRRLYEQTYEMRNALGLYVQDLRDQFNLGID